MYLDDLCKRQLPLSRETSLMCKGHPCPKLDSLPMLCVPAVISQRIRSFSNQHLPSQLSN